MFCQARKKVLMQYVECSKCGVKKSKLCYNVSMWQHRYNRKARSTDCADFNKHFRCRQCKIVKTQSYYTRSMWRKRFAKTPVCCTCAMLNLETEFATCALCQQRYHRSFFPEVDDTNDADRKLMCLDCCNPPCSLYECSTCNRCRNHNCKGGQSCLGKIVPLAKDSRPQSKDELSKAKQSEDTDR